MADDLVTNHPREEPVVVTVRLIRNFEYRTMKNLVIHGVNLNQTAKEFMAFTQQKIKEANLKPYLNNSFDSLNNFHVAHNSKTSDLVVKISEPLFPEDATLWDCGVRNESEISFFNKAALEEYKKHPGVLTWE